MNYQEEINKIKDLADETGDPKYKKMLTKLQEVIDIMDRLELVSGLSVMKDNEKKNSVS